MNIFLSSHSLRVSKKKDDKDCSPPEHYSLDNIPIKKDLLIFLQDFFQEHRTPVNNTQQQSYMRVRDFNTDNRIIFGIIESGVYGVRSDVLDVKTSQISYIKKQTDADVLPFYFLISIPENTDEGVVLLQRIGRHGFQSNLSGFLLKRFRADFPTCTLSINNLMLEEVVRRTILSGSIQELKCIKYKTPIDIVDGLDTGHNEVSGDIEITVKAKKIPFNERINEFFDKSRPVSSLVEIRDFNFSYDTVKVDVEINGTTYHYDLGNIGKFRQSLDITNDIDLDSEGRAVFDSIHRRAVRYLNEINSYLYR